MAAWMLPAALALQAAGTGLGFMESDRARKEAKKAAKEQRKQDALFNLMSIVGGQGAQRPSAITPPPQGGSAANVLAQLGAIAGQGYSAQQQAKTAAASQAATQGLADIRAEQLKLLQAGRPMSGASPRSSNSLSMDEEEAFKLILGI